MAATRTKRCRKCGWWSSARRYRNHGLSRHRRMFRAEGQVVYGGGGDQRRGEPAFRDLWRLHGRRDAGSAAGGAAQDDIEIMAYHGIAECFGQKDKWFTGVVVTNGAGSPRSGIYGQYSDDEMQKVRLMEQRKAAYVGEYACQIQ